MLLIAIALYLRIVTTPPPDVALLFSSLLFLSAKANKVPVSFIISHHLIASRLVLRRLLLFFTAPHHAIASRLVSRQLSLSSVVLAVTPLLLAPPAAVALLSSSALCCSVLLVEIVRHLALFLMI